MSREPRRYFPNPYPDFAPGATSAQGQALGEEAFRLAEKVWSSAACLQRDCDGGLYVGPAGVAYAMLHMANVPAMAPKRPQLLAWTSELLQPHLQYLKHDNSRQRSGFLLGSAGVHAVAAAVADAQGNANDKEKANLHMRNFASCCPPTSPLDFLGYGSEELFVGRAGYLLGALWVHQKCGLKPIPMEKIEGLWKAVVESGRKYSASVNSPSPLMYSYHGTQYLGAAHGLSAILQVLLCFPSLLAADSSAEKDIRASVDFYMSLQQQDGNFPCAMDELGRHQRPESDQLVHWCHGAPGAVYMLAKAYLRWHDKSYLDACLRCGEVVWKKGLLRKGPGICHGVSGNGYVFLLLHRLTGDARHLYRAEKFAAFMKEDRFVREARVPDCPMSLYEGLAGAACFLADLTQPQKAAFPFFDVFEL